MIEHSDGLRIIIEKKLSNGIRDYTEILKSMKGADPREVWDIYKDFNPRDAQKEYDKIGLVNSYPKFLEPHPAYSQWRLTPESTKNILGSIEDKNYPFICFLGCPILASKFDESSSRTLALDIDESNLGRLKPYMHIEQYDVNNELPNDFKGKFACVISDPPWYYDDIQRFVARGSELLREGGTIYFSLPGLLTKPSIIQERLNFQKWFSESGLVVDTMSPIAEYEVPAFEYKAYEDIPAFTGESWRVGDWVKLKKVDNRKITIEKNNQDESWLKYNLAGKRVFLRNKEKDSGNVGLSPLYADGSLVLNSVSKRNSLVSQIDIWTSRNGVMHIDSGFNQVRNILWDLQNNFAIKYNDASDDTAGLLRKLIEV